MPDLKPLGQVLHEMQEAGTIEIIEPEPTADDLCSYQITPERDVLLAAKAELEQRVPLSDGGRYAHAAQLRRIERQLRWNDERDRRKARCNQPPGVNCLGYGARHPQVYQHPELHIPDPDHRTVYGWYCQCPAGEEAYRRDLAIRQDARQRIEAAHTEHLWGSTGLNVEYRDFTLNGWLASMKASSANAYLPAAAVAKRLVAWEKGTEWMYLSGPVGRGKTGIVTLLSARALARGQTVLLKVVPDLLDDIRRTFRPDAEADDAVLMDSLTGVDWLVLDDIGKEKPSRWVKERLYRLVDKRYRDHKRTLFTSNVDLDTLASEDALMESIADRISQRCGDGGVTVLDGLPNLRHAP